MLFAFSTSESIASCMSPLIIAVALAETNSATSSKYKYFLNDVLMTSQDTVKKSAA